MKTNGQLQKDVYEELKWDPRIHEGDIGVTAHDGVVTLSGTIPNFAEKWAAEGAAERVAGVSAIINNITVKLPGTHRHDDEEIAAAAVQAFNLDFWVPRKDIKVKVENGWISLSGEVEWEYQRSAAERVLRHLKGVKGISNLIKVQPKVKPAEIKKKIESALMRTAKQDADKISVQVHEGEVELSGKVHSWSEKKDAEWAAWGTPGVKKVKNQVRVQIL